ncbi:hypothetical protein F5883DRAFT_717919 [Diaporthe sp. PMI_573]|nr:hypothetical protein F5883DRAFT_717919 [Diaporthaceae sp. PMI_573]
MCPSTAAGTGDVHSSVDGTSNREKCTVPTVIDPIVAVKPAIATSKDTTSTDREKKMLDTILERNGWTLRADKWLAEEIHGCCCCDCSICVDQQRGTWLVQLFVLAQFAFVGGVDIYTGLWAGAGFVCTAAWASLGVSVLAFGINIWGAFHPAKYYLAKVFLLLYAGFLWAPIEIALKSHGLRVLDAANGGDSTIRTIRVLFDLDIAAFTVLELFATYCVGYSLYIIITDRNEEEEEGPKKLRKNQTSDEEAQGSC